ncbi:MAG TPA: hypothetical protein VM692_15030, partial [Gammaproteobacteria bacterium]|nr:hypothetical protein [Gammaproteobacteria bacterium]
MTLANRRLATLAVFAGALAYFLLFRRYGFQIEDEGTLLFQLDRAARGELPYTDFHTGYTPGFFAAGAALLRLAHWDVASLRTVLAVLQAGVAASLYALAAPLTGAALAVVAPLAFVAFLPVWPGDFASFNVPYPAWFANVAWMATALAMTSFARRGRLAPLFVAGLAAGAAFAIKPNAGAFALAAASWTVAMTATSRTALDRAAAIGSCAVMLAGVWFAFGLTVRSIDAAVHLPPCIAIAVLAAWRARGALASPSHPGAAAACAALVAGFALPTIAWALPTLARLGTDGFLREVLLIGSNAAGIYWLAHPAPQLWAAVSIGGALAVAGAGHLVARGRVRPAPLLAAASLAVVAALLFL